MNAILSALNHDCAALFSVSCILGIALCAAVVGLCNLRKRK